MADSRPWLPRGTIPEVIPGFQLFSVAVAFFCLCCACRRDSQFAALIAESYAKQNRRFGRLVPQLDDELDTQGRPKSTDGGPRLPQSMLLKVFDASPNGLLVVDAQARIAAANAALLRMFGYQPGDLVGKPLAMLDCERGRDEQHGLSNCLNSTVENRTLSVGRELRVRHFSGREIQVEIGLNSINLAQGVLVLISFIDISRWSSLETAFGRIFETGINGKVLVDAEGRMALLNDQFAKMLGHERAGLIGQNIEMFLPERYRARHGSLMRSYREKPSTRTMGVGRELTALHANGSELAVEIGLSEVVWQSQNMTFATIVDISARRRAETKLRQANESLREFSYVVSHDLQGPLRGMTDLIEWMREDLGDSPDPNVLRNLDRMADRVRRMERLIADLLSFARAEQVDADCTLVDFAEVVRGILRLNPVPAGFHVDVAVDAVPISAPRVPIETVLRNLIANAVKHHDGQAGRISVEVNDDDSFCRVSVTDDGPGVPESAQQRVFRLFQTVSTPDSAGSGLGLAFSKRLVEVHGGRIDLLSPVHNGRGARFCFWWPRVLRG